MVVTSQITLEEYCKEWGKAVKVVTHPVEGRDDRVLVAAVDFKPGDIIFVEESILHTLHPESSAFVPCECDIPRDFQRLLYEYILLQRDAVSDFVPLLNELSEDGVSNELAQEADPERIADWREAAKTFHDKMKTRFKNRRKKKKNVESEINESNFTLPKTDELEKLIWKIETNCHSKTPTHSEQPNVSTDDGAEEEEQCGLWILGSFMEHSCLPNATVILSNSALKLHALQSISTGDIITISYQENDYQPRSVRQQNLLRRGFLCACDLCSGQDYMRTAHCPACTEGLVCPFLQADNSENWNCSSCDLSSPSSSDFVNRIKIREESLLLPSVENFDSADNRLMEIEQGVETIMRSIIQMIKFSFSDFAYNPSIAQLTQLFSYRNIPPSVLEMISPLDITHHLIYNFFKESLFANSSFRLIFCQDAPLYAISYLVFACVRTMPRCKMSTENLPSSQLLAIPSSEDIEVIASLSHSEELKHNLVWLSNMAQEQKKMKLLEWAKKLCDIFIV